jgi:phosphatidylinositol alpha-1,6-mannosyltransferase
VSEKPLRIVVSTPTFLPVVGGAELGIHEIFSRLGERHDVTILTPTPPDTAVAAYGAFDYETLNYRVIHPAAWRDSAPGSRLLRGLNRCSLPYLVDLDRLSRQKRVDVVNFHFVRPHGLAIMWLRRVRHVPTVLSLIGRGDVVSAMTLPRRTYARAVLRNADAIVPISEFCVTGAPRGPKVRVIPYGVDSGEFSPGKRSVRLRRRLGIRDEEVMLFALQRLVRVKRVDVLIRMMTEPGVRDAGVKLVVGGQGEEGVALRRLSRELGVDDLVAFAGYIPRSEVGAYFASADVFVFHSLFETFGIVFAQAMASGLPIVAAQSSCVAEVVGSQGGRLIQPFDVRAFANAVLSLAACPRLREEIGRRNRRRAVSGFDWEVVVGEYEDVLRNAVSDPGRGP